jgi:hypothetical protein
MLANHVPKANPSASAALATTGSQIAQTCLSSDGIRRERDEDGEDNFLLRPDHVKALRCGGRAFPVWAKRTHQGDQRDQYYDGEREHPHRITRILPQRSHHEAG